MSPQGPAFPSISLDTLVFLLFLPFSFHPSPSSTQTLNIGFLQNSTVNFSTFYSSHTTTDSFADSDLHVCISRPLTSEAFISCSSLYPSTMYRGRLNWRLLAAMNSGHRGRNIRGSATGSTVERCVANILSLSDLSAHLFLCLDRYFKIFMSSNCSFILVGLLDERLQGIEPRALCILSMWFSTDLHLEPSNHFKLYGSTVLSIFILL